MFSTTMLLSLEIYVEADMIFIVVNIKGGNRVDIFIEMKFRVGLYNHKSQWGIKKLNE